MRPRIVKIGRNYNVSIPFFKKDEVIEFRCLDDSHVKINKI